MEKEVNIRRAFLYVLIASVAVSALIGIGVFLFRDFGYYEVRVLMTALTVTATSILGLACGAYLESGRARVLPLAGIALSIIAGIMTLLMVWNVSDDSENFIRSTATVTLLALSCSLLSLLSLARLDRRFAWSRIAAYVCVSLLSAVLIYLIWFEPVDPNDRIIRVIGILSILVAAITVMTPVFHKLSAGDAEVAEIDAEIEKLKARIEQLEDKKANLAQTDADA
jgi:hypothetical protein